jgi:hypothetical protein
MERAQADRLIAELGAKIGVPDMKLNAAGICTLSFDGGAVVVTITCDPAAGGLDLSTGLRDVAPTPARLARALAANFCWRPVDGAIFALDRDNGRLQLRRRCPGEGLDLKGLLAVLERFVKHALAWTKILGELDEQKEGTVRQEAPRMPAAGLRA